MYILFFPESRTFCPNFKFCSPESPLGTLESPKWGIPWVSNLVVITYFNIPDAILPLNPCLILNPFHPRTCYSFQELFFNFSSPLQRMCTAFYILCFQQTHERFLCHWCLLIFPPIHSLTPCCHVSSWLISLGLLPHSHHPCVFLFSSPSHPPPQIWIWPQFMC